MIQGKDLYHGYENAIASLRALAGSSSSTSGLTTKDLNTALFGLNFAVRGLTGMNAEDALGWMTGDYAVELGFSPSFSDIKDVSAPLKALPVDFGIVIAATDPAAAQQVYDGLSQALTNLPADNVTMTEETLDSGTKALVFTITSPDMDFPVELLASTGNGVFAFGTRRMVTAAVNPQNQGLDTAPGFVAASGSMLSDPNALLYIGGSSLEPLARAMTASGNSPAVRQQGKQVQMALDLIDSITISDSVLPDGSGALARVVWTLPA